MNPIETVFSKFKWFVKSAARRTVEALWNVCGSAIDHFPEPECRRHFQHRSYRDS